MLLKALNWAASGIIWRAIDLASAPEAGVAACAGAEVRAIPTVAAATAAVERAFFGGAMRRVKETDTENLLRRGQESPAAGARGSGGGAARCRDPRGGPSAPGDVVQR